MAKSPAFQFYVQDFIVGTLNFSAEEVGAYLLLLCHQWDKGHIKESEVETVARLPMQKLARVLCKFLKNKGKFYNKRMAEMVREKNDFSKIQSQKGKAGAQARWQRPSSGHRPAIDLPMPENGSSSSSSIKEIYKEKKWQNNPTAIEIDSLELTEIELNQCKEYLYRLQNKNVTDARICDLWKAFKIQQFTGGKFYQTRADCVDHFRNWAKTKDLETPKGEAQESGLPKRLPTINGLA